MSIVVHRFEFAPGPLDNPLKGWCSYTDAGEIYQPYSMVFRYISWKELEPREGDYRFAEWERREWEIPAANGKHIVFRVFIDYPKEKSGLPDWLRAKGVRVTRYTGEGGGESPDYDNPVMIAAMERLIAALGRRYNTHPHVAFIQLGLLGFWGEWHTYTDPKLFAGPPTRQRVVDAYHAAFPDKLLMARYAQEYPGRQSWLGFHDDYFPEDTGDEGPTKDWYFLYNINRSGRAENWKRAGIGGEMIPDQARKWMGTQFAFTLKRAEEAHFSWVGPYSPALEKPASPEFVANCQRFVRRIGYEFCLKELRLPDRYQSGEALPFTLTGVNQGVAPFYYRWPIRFALRTPSGGVVEAADVPEADLRTWLPGPFTLSGSVRFRPVPAGKYTLSLGIVDPWTGKPAIGFANKLTRREGWTDLTTLTVM